MKYMLLVILWVCFGLTHSLLISPGVIGWMREKLGRYYVFYRLLYNLIALLTITPLLVYTNRLDTELLIKFSPPWNILQAILLAGSTIIILAAFRSYDPLEFLGIRQVVNFYSGPPLPESTSRQIVNTGLLGIVRHPMYLATIIFMWSLNATLADILTRTVLTLYIIVGTFLEEKKLVSEYGQSYIEYQNKCQCCCRTL